jgi:arsenate reductase-like glutaredoxin family protein
MDANGIEPAEIVSASKKLGREDAARIARAAARVIVARGKNVAEFKTGGKASAECIDAMLGPTGNLRAPTLRVGQTVVVGFDEASYRAILG